MIDFLIKRIFAVFQFVLRIIRKALCCFKRTRRHSGEPTTLTSIRVVSDGEVVDNIGWDNWEESGNSHAEPVNAVEEQIRIYRQQRANLLQAKPEEDDEKPVDFFLDMTPKIVKQKKVLLRKEEASNQTASLNLTMAPEAVYSSPELGEWEDTQTWEAEADDDVNVSDLLREQKRQERERRQEEQQRRKFDRVRPPVSARIS